MIETAISRFSKDWEIRSIECRKRISLGLSVTEEIHLKYFLSFYNAEKQEADPIGWFKDYSLIYDYGIYEFKPGRILPAIWNSGKHTSLNLINEIISFETRVLSKGVLDVNQYRHMIQLKNLVGWVCSKKLGDENSRESKKIIAGDFKNEKYFTVKRTIK